LDAAYRAASLLDSPHLQGSTCLGWLLLPEVEKVILGYTEHFLEQVCAQVRQDSWRPVPLDDLRVRMPIAVTISVDSSGQYSTIVEHRTGGAAAAAAAAGGAGEYDEDGEGEDSGRGLGGLGGLGSRSKSLGDGEGAGLAREFDKEEEDDEDDDDDEEDDEGASMVSRSYEWLVAIITHLSGKLSLLFSVRVS
jgi:hypothetical protein